MDPEVAKVSVALRKICRKNSFVLDLMEEAKSKTGIHSHSACKFAVNKSHGNGCSRDDTDHHHHGRWKGHERQEDTYIHMAIPYVNTKGVVALYTGGPIAFLVHSDSGGITNYWLLEHIVPNMCTANVPHQVFLAS